MGRAARIITSIVWLSAAGFVVWIIGKNLVASGVATVTFDVVHGSPAVSHFASKEPTRTIAYPSNGSEAQTTQLITASPLYFDVTMPRAFEAAEITFRYQNPEQQPALQLGVQQPDGSFAFTDLADENPILDQLPDEWEKVQDGELVLWQKNNEYLKQKLVKEREKAAAVVALDAQKNVRVSTAKRQHRDGEIDDDRYHAVLSDIDHDYTATLQVLEDRAVVTERPAVRYASVSEFLADLPNPQLTLQYNYNLLLHETLPEYTHSSKGTVIRSAIRGPVDLLTYVGAGETFDMTLSVQSLNREVGKDQARVRLTGADGDIVSMTTPLLGDDDALGDATPGADLVLHEEHLPEGVYQISLSQTNDMFVRSITTSQRYLMFQGGLTLMDNEEFADVLGPGPFTPTHLYATGWRVSAITTHTPSLQTISVDRQQLKLATTGVPVSITGLNGVSTVDVPLNDARISTDGYLAFSPNQIFALPNGYATVSSQRDPKDYDFIFARYRVPEREGEWRTATATLSTPPLYFSDNVAHFAIALPDLAEAGKTLEAKSIQIRFTRPPITLQYLFTKARHLLDRLF